MLDLILRTGFQPYFFDDDVSIARATLCTGVIRGGEGQLLTAVALDHEALGTPPVDLAHRYVLNLITCLNVLDDFRHSSSSPFPHPRTGTIRKVRVKARRSLLCAL
jgi:hypothetical protein